MEQSKLFNELKKALSKFGFSIHEANKNGSQENSLDLNKDKQGIVVPGHKGTWYVIDNCIKDDKEYFLLEHEKYGDETACVITDVSGKIVLDDVYNGFEDLNDFIDNQLSLEEVESSQFEKQLIDNENDMLIKDHTGSIVGKINADGIVYSFEHVFSQIKNIASYVKEYLERFEKASNIPIEPLKNYRLLAEYNNVVLGCSISDSYTQFATWELDKDGDYNDGHYFSDQYKKAKDDFSERSGLYSKPQFSETELKLIFSSLVFSGKTGDLDFSDQKKVETLKEKIFELVPALVDFEKEQNELDLEPEYPL